MTESDEKKPASAPNLSDLTDFQFAPSWARPKSDKPRSHKFSPQEGSTSSFAEGGHKRFSGRGDKRREGGRSFDKESGRSFDRERGPRAGGRPDFSRNKDGKFGKFDKDKSFERRPRPVLEPTTGIRVELRPVDTGLSALANEVHLHKRCYSLYDLAKVIMGARDRYEIWFIKEEGGPDMFLGKKLPSVWLTREEAFAHFWQSPALSELYVQEEEAVEAPKGQFMAVARCGMTGDLLGPVNWHGYQVALARHHAEKLAHVPVERFRSQITQDKTPEALEAWMSEASKKIVWKPVLGGAEAVTLSSRSEVEAHFNEHHFQDFYEQTGKCFVLGDINSRSLAAGLFAHLRTLVDNARRYPAQIIPNLCHGLARHHLPIFKWNKGHHTGPSRPHALAGETILAQRPAAIMEWVKQHPGGKVEAMLKELAPAPVLEEKEAEQAQLKADSPDMALESADVPLEALLEGNEEMASTPEHPPVEASEDIALEEMPVAPEEEKAEAALEASVEEKAIEIASPDTNAKQEDLLVQTHACWVADLLWLLQQGFVLVMKDGSAYCAKNALSGSAEQKPAGSEKKAKKKKKKPAKALVASGDKPEKAPVLEENSQEAAPETTVEAEEAEADLTLNDSLEAADIALETLIAEAQEEGATPQDPQQA